MTDIQPYVFPTTGQAVRTIAVDGEPWFVAVDVCAVLGIGDTRQAVNSLDEDERCTTPVTDSLGREQQTYVVNEAGLYSLILRSRKPEARAFKRWITHEVLPAIRRTGSYSVAPAPAAVMPSHSEALRGWAGEIEAREAAEARAAELEPDATAWQVLASGHGDYSVADAAKILTRDPAITIGERGLFTHLSEAGWTYRARGDGRWRAYQRHVDCGRLTELLQHYEHPRTGEVTLAAPQLRVSPKGLRDLHHQLGGVRPLRLGEQLTIGGM